MEGLAQVHETITISVFTGLLLVAAVWDVWQFRIPNLVNGLLAAALVLAAATSPHPMLWPVHAGAGLLMLAIGAPLFAYGIMGGGDVKLLVVLSAWFGIAYLPVFLVAVGMLGGVLALVILALRQVAPWALAVSGWAVRLPPVLAPKGAIPYGVAIAAGAILNLHYLPVLGSGA